MGESLLSVRKICDPMLTDFLYSLEVGVLVSNILSLRFKVSPFVLYVPFPFPLLLLFFKIQWKNAITLEAFMGNYRYYSSQVTLSFGGVTVAAPSTTASSVASKVWFYTQSSCPEIAQSLLEKSIDNFSKKCFSNVKLTAKIGQITSGCILESPTSRYDNFLAGRLNRLLRLRS